MRLFHSFWFNIVLSLFIFSVVLHAQNDYSYSYLPKTVYSNQLFPVTVVGKTDDTPQFIFDSTSQYRPLFNDPLIVKNGNESFYTFYFKAEETNVLIPQLFIHSSNNEFSLAAHKIPISKLKPDRFFSGVLATKLKIQGYQVSNYDTKNHIVTLMLEALEANLEDMHLNHVYEYGIENIKREYAKVKAEFYVVLPREQKELKFSYFNTISKHFETLNIPVKVVNASVTTQSDLNPKVDAFKRLKLYALVFFSLFFLIMFIWKRDFFYLVLGTVSIITLLTFYIPHKKICVKQGSPLYILPTETSTIGTRIDKQLNMMLLSTRGEYNKVEYKKGIIGWIKNEDLCKN